MTTNMPDSETKGKVLDSETGKGKVLLTIEGTFGWPFSRYCPLWIRKQRAEFCNNMVIVTEESQPNCACYPPAYHQCMYMKQNVCGITVEKASVPTWFFWLGVLLALGGILTFIAALDTYRPGSGIGLALLMLLLSAFFFVLPFLFVPCYTTTLDVKEAGSTMKRVQVRSQTHPDETFLLEYVYGCLNESMSAYHSVSHHVTDGVMEPLRDVRFREVSAARTDPDAMVGKNLCEIDEDLSFSLCGCLKYHKHVRAQFKSTMVILREEGRFICYPDYFKFVVLPKYKVRDLTVTKSNWTFFLLCMGIASLTASVVHLTVERNPNAGLAFVLGVLGVLFVVLPMKAVSPCLDTYETLITYITSSDQGFGDSVLTGVLGSTGTTVVYWIAAFGFIFGGSGMVSGRGMIVLWGIIMLVLGVLCLLNAMVRTNRHRRAASMGFAVDYFQLMSKREPDKEFLIEYVFGAIGPSMQEYHTLTHLLKDGLAAPLKYGPLELPFSARVPFSVPKDADGKYKDGIVPVETLEALEREDDA
jgi:hypothetical protein